MNLDHDLFLSSLKTMVTNCPDEWVSSDADGDLNTYVYYSAKEYTYKTWYLETTVMPEDAGMLVSCKIDYERTTGDDHIIIMCGYALTPDGPVMKFAQASVQFSGSEQNSFVGKPVTDGPMATGISNSLSSVIEKENFGSIDSSTDGRQYLPYIAQFNVQAIIDSVS